MYSSKIKLRIIVGFIIYIVIFLFTAIYARIPGENLVRWSSDGKKVFFPLVGKADGLTWKRYTTTFYSPKERNAYILLSRVDSKGIAIKVNGEEVFSIGKWLNANIWTYTFAAPIRLKKGVNTIEMDLKFLFDFYSVYPPSIVDEAWPLILKMNLLFSGIPTFGSYALFAFFIYFMVLSIKVKKVRHKYFTVGLSLLFTAIFLSNMGFWYSVGPGRLILFYKRLVYASIYLAFAFYQDAILFIANKRPKYHFIEIFAVVVAILILTLPDFRTARSIGLKYASPLFILSIVLTTYRTVKYRLRRLIPSSVVLITALLHFYITNLLDYGVVPIMAYGLSYHAFSLVNFLRSEHEHLYEESEIDPLTGAYNRRILRDLHVFPQDVLVYFDIDSFKNINDSFGHSFGDEVLRALVKVIKDNIKGKDVVIRVGGDEFAVILRDCTKDDAHETVNAIIKDFKKTTGFDVSYGFVSLENGLKEALDKADRYMYQRKERKRNRYDTLMDRTA